MGLLIPWRSYVETIDDKKSHDQIAQLFEVGEQLIVYLSHKYGLSHARPPIILVKSAIDLSMSSDIEAFSIILPRGFIDFCLQCVPLFVDLSISEMAKTKAYNVNSTTMLMFLLVIAHEYFHLTRGHYQVQKEDILTESERRTALEYDADNMAAAGLFRFAQERFHEMRGDLEIKKIMTYSIFWPMRGIIKLTNPYPFKINNYPSIYFRLVYTVAKLIWIDNFDPATHELTENVHAEAPQLINVLFHCENEYSKRNKVPLRTSQVFKFLEEYGRTKGALMFPIITLWDQVKPYVAKHSSLKLVGV